MENRDSYKLENNLDSNREDPFFFLSQGHKLFGVLHRPNMTSVDNTNDEKASLPKPGIVMCAPFGEEKSWSHRVFVSFARFMSARGFPVMRFDYMGNGDSDGDFENMTVSTCIQDIIAAITELKTRSSIKNVGLVGLRLGATLAAKAADKLEVSFLVMWDPVVSGDRYFQECLRSNLATQLIISGKVMTTRQQLIEKLKGGESINIDGNLVSTEFYHELARLTLSGLDSRPVLPVFVVQIESKPTTNIRKDYQSFAGNGIHPAWPELDFKIVTVDPFWKELRTYYQQSEALFSDTESWIDSLKDRMSKTTFVD